LSLHGPNYGGDPPFAGARRRPAPADGRRSLREEANGADIGRKARAGVMDGHRAADRAAQLELYLLDAAAAAATAPSVLQAAAR
jgi:hypothetical protein